MIVGSVPSRGVFQNFDFFERFVNKEGDMGGKMVEFSSNGSTSNGYLSTPASGKGPGVVVIQEWWGLVDHIKDVADRFAREGFVAVAPDLYLHVEVEKQLRAKVADLIMRVGAVSVAQVREALESSRKFVVPFVEYLDRVGFTKRVGDQRVLCSAEKP